MIKEMHISVDQKIYEKLKRQAAKLLLKPNQYIRLLIGKDLAQK